MSNIVLGRITVDKDKRWADTDERLAKIRLEVTDLLFACGHRIDKNLVQDVSTLIYNREINAFYKKDLSEL